MSLKKFFQKIWNAIEDFFQGLLPELKEAIHIGVAVVEKMKEFMATPVPDIITAIIPGDLDDAIKVKLREMLPKIFINLRLAQECSELTDPDEIVACGLRTLNSIEGDFKSAFLHDLSILIAQVAADGKLDWKDGVYILQWYYDHRK